MVNKVFNQKVWDEFKELNVIQLVLMFDIVTNFLENGDEDVSRYSHELQVIFEKVVKPELLKTNEVK